MSPASPPLRLGRIPWINCFPIYSAIDRDQVHVDAELVTGTAAELNDLLAAGELQLSVVSAVEYARAAASYHLLPDLAISCDGPVRSVALFSRRPVHELDGATVLRTASSRTSVLLLELLCRHRWRIRPRFATVRAESTDLGALAGFPHEAVLVIGDACLVLAAQGIYPYMTDLGLAWREWTGLPFVFAVWAARRDADQVAVRRVHQGLLASRAWGLDHLDELARAASTATGIDPRVTREYLGDLDYALSYRHLAGLTDFFRRLAEDGMVPDGSLSFITAA
ncbi:MAG: menaquinone biosynthesis protein [Gemmatimonadetes bacterium]|nr:menaquinone biosynthesis protein [Gemmatimonadota bacterium]MCC7133944.1 menaquinone biosynthesis protein [Gemmatimonadales bacterium]